MSKRDERDSLRFEFLESFASFGVGLISNDDGWFVGILGSGDDMNEFGFVERTFVVKPNAFHPTLRKAIDAAMAEVEGE